MAEPVILGDCTLYLGDCLEVMPTIEAGGVDVSFYDPPYNVGKDYGTYKDNLPQEQYETWMNKVIKETRRISRGGIVVYVGGKLTRLYGNLIPDGHLIIVEKRAAGVFSGNYMLQYHSMYSTVKPLIKCKDLWNDVRLPGEGYFFHEQRFDHPGMTGLEMTLKVFRHFTSDNDTVLDPFMGTGTTGAACVKTGRKFIGIEIGPKYFDIACKRIEQAQKQIGMDI